MYSIGRMMQTIGRNLQYGGDLSQEQTQELQRIQKSVGYIIKRVNSYLKTKEPKLQIQTANQREFTLYTTNNGFPSIQTTIPFLWYDVNQQREYIPVNILSQLSQNNKTQQQYLISYGNPTLELKDDENETICFSAYQKLMNPNQSFSRFPARAIQYQYNYNQKIENSIPESIKDSFQTQNINLDLKLKPINTNNLKEQIESFFPNQKVNLDLSTNSKQKPLFIKIRNQQKYILKQGDYSKEDPRNDSLIMAMAAFLNRQKFNIPTYAVYPLGIQNETGYVLLGALEPKPVSLNSLQTTTQKQEGGSIIFRRAVSKLFPVLQVEGIWNFLTRETIKKKNLKTFKFHWQSPLFYNGFLEF